MAASLAPNFRAIARAFIGSYPARSVGDGSNRSARSGAVAYLITQSGHHLQENDSNRSRGSADVVGASTRLASGTSLYQKVVFAIANDIDSSKKGFKFFRDRARDGKEFSLDELEAASGWSKSSIDTYKSKQWKDLLEKTNNGQSTVRKEFLRLSEPEFLDHISQKRPLFTRYSRKGHEHYIMFEFLLPLTRESQLRSALDELFYSDTVEQRLREIGVAKLGEIVTRNGGESADEFYARIVELAANRFGGYSVSHVSGRYKASAVMTREAALEHVMDGGRYLIDETTAVVRFIIPCQTGAFEFSDTLEPAKHWLDLFEAVGDGSWSRVFAIGCTAGNAWRPDR